MDRPNTVSELGALQLARPALDAPKSVVAAWYTRKAVVLEHLAAEGSTAAREQARAARLRARRLVVAAWPG
ncbi:hypothetical protein BAY59_01235 [Prauserella coralliicola]|nr:hypothetical protein BAY59_01235 [Prauserella coralliicola]